MSVIQMKQLLEAGVHFGHQTSKWNPKMAKYIFDKRNGVHIINLEMTVDAIDVAYDFIAKVAASGRKILFVGKKKQAKETIQQEATRCGMYYMNYRWLGGTLTNYATIRTRIAKLNKIDEMELMHQFDILPKTEVQALIKERDKLKETLGGIRNMGELPGALFVVDLKAEHLAIKEARALGIPIVGMVDTNCDPEEVDIPIPANDDAIKSIKLIAGAMADAVIAGREGRQDVSAETVSEEAAAEEIATEQPSDAQ